MILKMSEKVFDNLDWPLGIWIAVTAADTHTQRLKDTKTEADTHTDTRTSRTRAKYDGKMCEHEFWLKAILWFIWIQSRQAFLFAPGAPFDMVGPTHPECKRVTLFKLFRHFKTRFDLFFRLCLLILFTLFPSFLPSSPSASRRNVFRNVLTRNERERKKERKKKKQKKNKMIKNERPITESVTINGFGRAFSARPNESSVTGSCGTWHSFRFIISSAKSLHCTWSAYTSKSNGSTHQPRRTRSNDVDWWHIMTALR